MSLSVLLPNHEALVKEEEYDDYDYNQELDSGLESSGMADLQALLMGDAQDVKREPEESPDSEEQHQAIAPRLVAYGISASAQPVPLFVNSGIVKEEADETLIKDEPIDFWDEDSQVKSNAVDVANHPTNGIAALLARATGKRTVRQPARYNEVLNTEEMAEARSVPLSQQASSSRRKTIRSSNSEDDGEMIYISYDDNLLHRAPKRGRPMGSRYSPHEVATDPKKRRQANNRDAAHRYREKKKMEMFEKKFEEEEREEMNARLLWQVSNMSKAVSRWKGLCLRAFNFLPDFDFEDHSPPSVPSSSSRRSVSATPSNDSTSSLPSSLQSPLLSLASSLFDRAPLSAAAKSRAKKTEHYTLLKIEEADLTSRNDALRAEALQIYIEIVNMRKKLGFSKARTSADKDLPSLLRSSEYSSTQISDFLSTTQS